MKLTIPKKYRYLHEEENLPEDFIQPTGKHHTTPVTQREKHSSQTNTNLASFLGKGSDSLVYETYHTYSPAPNNTQIGILKLYKPHLTLATIAAYHQLHHILAAEGPRTIKLPADYCVFQEGDDDMPTSHKKCSLMRYNDKRYNTLEVHILPLSPLQVFSEGNHLASRPPYISGPTLRDAGHSDPDHDNRIPNNNTEEYHSQTCRCIEYHLATHTPSLLTSAIMHCEALGPLNIKVTTKDETTLRFTVTDLGKLISYLMTSISLEVQSISEDELDDLSKQLLPYLKAE